MEKLPMCRVCLAENVRMYVVVNKNMHELYKKLTDTPFITKDNRPMLVCFYCCTKLKQCCRFQRKCLEGEELFAQMMNEDYESKPLINQDHLDCYNGLIQSPMVHVSIVDECQTESDDIKEELPAVCEGPDDIIEPKEECKSDELELENLNSGYSDIEDIAAQQSESDLEDDLPLMDIKTEMEKEQEVPKKKRRASDSQWAPVAKNPGLHLRRTEIEDVITEEQMKNDQLDTKVTNSQNGTSETVTKYKESLTYTKPRVTNTNKTRIHAGKSPIKCDTCQRCYSCKADLTRHIGTHTGIKPFKCDVCQHCFSQKWSLTHHIRTHNGEKPYKCDICQRCFSWKADLKRHIRTHTGIKPFKCDVCQHCFIQKSSLTNHIRTHTGEKPFQCDVCQCCFRVKGHLKRHIVLTHTGEKPFLRRTEIEDVITEEQMKNDQLDTKVTNSQNGTSETVTKYKESLTYTKPRVTNTNKTRIHAGKSPIKCDICQRSFRCNANLTRHIRTHTGIKPFKCDVCQHCFSQKSSLTHHIRTHTGEKPYKCDICQRCFSWKADLKRHIRTHTGIKPFKCDVCQHCFIEKSSLTNHIRTHTGEKPFQCDVCQCCFRVKGHLKRHIVLTHTGEKPFKCSIYVSSFVAQSRI